MFGFCGDSGQVRIGHQPVAAAAASLGRLGGGTVANFPFPNVQTHLPRTLLFDAYGPAFAAQRQPSAAPRRQCAWTRETAHASCRHPHVFARASCRSRAAAVPNGLS
eukprot:689210-Pleurochrysis_carterae.AAC.1